MNEHLFNISAEHPRPAQQQRLASEAMMRREQTFREQTFSVRPARQVAAADGERMGRAAVLIHGPALEGLGTHTKVRLPCDERIAA